MSIEIASKKFRTDINGLRAIAVLSVLLFHFNVPGFSGGFIGVDVFFVISGFLMTGIIVKGLAKSKFNFIGFYLARARRIIPALLILSMLLLIFGWFYLSVNDYQRLAKEIDRAVLFLSNNYFYSKIGYFEPSAHERFLLHTWSLSVEWQFYIIYPVILALVYRVFSRGLVQVVVTLFFASFFFSVYKTSSDQSYAFYLLATRAWEMLLGGIVFFVSNNERCGFNKKISYYTGLLLIVLSVTIYTGATAWPGINALIPALGAALILYANQDSVLTSNIVFQKVGDWSYSVYLWHWPLAVIIIMYDLDSSVELIASLFGLSIILGWLSYRLVETPARIKLSQVKNKTAIFIFIILIALFLLLTKYIRNNNGIKERLPEEAMELFDQADNKNMPMELCHKQRDKGEIVECSYGALQNEVDTIVIGDSHAMSLIAGYTEYAKDRKVLDWTQSACPTIKNVKTTGRNPDICKEFLSARLDELDKYPGVPVLLANRYSAHLLGYNEESAGYLDLPRLYFSIPYSVFSKDYQMDMYQGYKNTLCEIAENNPLYIVKPTPELKLNVPEVMGRFNLIGQTKRIFIERAEHLLRSRMALQLLDEVVADCGATLLDPIPYLCEDERCYGDINYLPIYFDDDHLNVLGSKRLIPMYNLMDDND
ncbi:hypothetical protein AKN94_05545 [Thiopseudomonas alkaliphila]|uniref:acyltransferase family protein n=1 Tax=Thiopseudomonas alkaliphila TaxID=1697053 RepID=UPI00069F0B43|nr:acyltransferase family protein [Thiopseudomonas alkaliphila]AKX46879.1 hypothetical protein AKN94_05545 [Thiopseudomonas alkaliphila]